MKKLAKIWSGKEKINEKKKIRIFKAYMLKASFYMVVKRGV